MAHYTQDIRLYSLEPLSAGAIVTATTTQHHYLRNVVRVGLGHKIRLFNQETGEFEATIEEQTKKETQFLVHEQYKEPVQNEVPFTVFFAPFKRGMDTMIAKATDFGVTHFQPVTTDYTVAKKLKKKRYETIAIEAAEQVGRLTIPTFHNTIALRDIETYMQPTSQYVFADETLSHQDSAFIESIKEIAPESLGIIIGPEGGFSPKERKQLHAIDHVTAVSLGSHIYKTDSAILAMSATIAMIRHGCH